MITDAITYNVRERGRKHRGADRNFDTVALAKLINSPSVQEQVKHGDMNGYFGHWPRIKFGMSVPEGGVLDGKVISIPPALRTVELSAEPDGTITHRAEFLDTNEGRTAARLYASKSGGFSSAIEAVPGTDPQVPRGFYGFDYVMEPNYTTNRGHKVVLDSVRAGEDATDLIAMLDAIMDDSSRAASALTQMFDSLHAQHLLALTALDQVSKDNDILIGKLATARKGSAVLDSLEDVRSAGLTGGARMSLDFKQYLEAELMPLESLPKGQSTISPELAATARRFGLKLP